MDALTALRNIAAIRAARVEPVDGAASRMRFMDDRIEHYTSRGLDRARALELTHEDRRAQF